MSARRLGGVLLAVVAVLVLAIWLDEPPATDSVERRAASSTGGEPLAAPSARGTESPVAPAAGARRDVIDELGERGLPSSWFEVRGRLVEIGGGGVAQCALEVDFQPSSERFLGGPSRTPMVTVRTDEGGHFRFASPVAARGWQFVAQLEGGESVFLGEGVWESERGRLRDLFLPPRRAVRGVLLDRAGEPVAGATIRWVDSTAPSDSLLALVPEGSSVFESSGFLYHLDEDVLAASSWRSWTRTALTGEDGTFRFDSRERRPVFSIESRDGAPHYYRVLHGDEDREVRVRLHAHRERRFQVVDQLGRPAAGAQLLVSRAGCWPGYAILQPREAVPEDGICTIEAELGDRIAVAARWSDDDPWTVRRWFEMDKPTPRQRMATFVLSAPRPFLVQIVDESGRAVSGADVSLLRPESLVFDVEHAGLPDFRELGPGSYLAEEVPSGLPGAQIDAPGFMPGFLFVDDSGVLLNGTCELHRATELEVSVRLSDGAPVPGARIQFLNCRDHSIDRPEGFTGSDGTWRGARVCSQRGIVLLQSEHGRHRHRWDGRAAEIAVVLEAPTD